MFSDLFIFELANNHQGDVNHGLKIINAIGQIKYKYNIKVAVKFQFRDYSTFIHPNSVDDSSNDKIKRFISTKLTWDEFTILIKQVRHYNMLTMCTPFDESSVNYINKMDIDIVKIGSPSLHDWPLLTKIKTDSTKPIILSSGGCDIKHIDKLVNFFKDKYLSLMHCVSIYPTPIEKMNLVCIQKFKELYPNLTIGFSTHETADNMNAIKIAYCLGARMFEKHVGMDILNKYSANPEQIEKWVESYLDTVKTIGTHRVFDDDEVNDLNKLYRGVFVNKDICIGDAITFSDIFYAFPKTDNGINSGEFEPFIASIEYKKNDSINHDLNGLDKNLLNYISKVKIFAFENKHDMPDNAIISHHYGTLNINKIGCVMYTIVDETLYSKKIIIMLKDQSHPEHYHKIKTETFIIIAGSMQLILNDIVYNLHKNDILTVRPYEKHSFSTSEGVIFEEIATSINTVPDSFYTDVVIQKKSDVERKTMFSKDLKI